MTISVGDRIPEINLTTMTNEGPVPVSFSDLFQNSIKTKLTQNKDITIKGLIKISKLIK